MCLLFKVKLKDTKDGDQVLLFKKKWEMRIRPDRNPHLRCGGKTAVTLWEWSTHLPDEGLGNVGFDKGNCPLSPEHLHQHAVLGCGFIDVFYKP